MKRRAWLIAALLGIALVAAGVWVGLTVRRAARQLLDAEDRLYATILTCELVSDYLKRTGFASWPRSWEDLRALPARDGGPFRWPEDEQRLQALVVVEFGVRLDEIARQGADTFRAIRPNGPAASIYLDVGVAPLLSDIHDHAKRVQETPRE